MCRPPQHETPIVPDRQSAMHLGANLADSNAKVLGHVTTVSQ